jgi:hypothetical protein
MRDKHLQKLKEEQDRETKKKLAEQKQKESIEKFFQSVSSDESSGPDIRDKLDELAQFLQEYTGPATGVYIGRLEKPRKTINEGDDDKAHVDRAEGVQKLIRFMYASKGHEFMKGKILKGDQGIAHSVFKAAAPAEGEPVAEEGEGEEGEEGATKAKSLHTTYAADDILATFKHLYIPQVVREPRMHFYRVPRLGSFMAVPFEYHSCLSAKALEEAVADIQYLHKAREEQEKAKAEWEEEQQKLRDDAERNGVPFEGENKQWEPLNEKPYSVKKKSYVVCLDTLGQDREFTEDQRRFILDTLKKFISLWEEKERRFLTRDRDLRL